MSGPVCTGGVFCPSVQHLSLGQCTKSTEKGKNSRVNKGNNTPLINFKITSNGNDDPCLYFEWKEKKLENFKIILTKGFQSLILLSFLEM